MAFFKNTAGQPVYLKAYKDGVPFAGDAANITAHVKVDSSAFVDVATAVTETDSTKSPGVYTVSPTQANTNGDALLFSGTSTTADVTIEQVSIYPTLASDYKADVSNLDAAVSSRSTFDNSSDTVTTDTASRTASQADISALATQTSVNTVNGVVDSVLAILSGTGTELTGTPDKTASLDDRIQLMFMALRNAVISQDGSQTIANDAGEAISIATQQVSGGVLTKGKFENVT